MELLAKILSDKEIIENAGRMTMNEFCEAMAAQGVGSEMAAKVYEMISSAAAPDDKELGEGELADIAGGGVYDGNNLGWYYGKCRNPECSGKRYVMQIDYKNLIVCTTCGDWVEF